MADAAALSGLIDSFPKISEADALAAYKIKIQRELEIWRLANKYKYVIDSDSLNQMIALEASKTSDRLLDAFGFDLDDLVLYSDKTGLKDTKEIAGLSKILEMQKATEDRKREK